MRPKRMSVFFPSFNEENNIASTVKKAIKVLSNLKLVEWEVLIVNDGSTDQTAQIADQLAQQHRQVRVIHQPNGGYGAALQTGFYESQFEVITYTDTDGQFDFSEVAKFIDKLDEADLIIGFRLIRAEGFFRWLFAKGWALSLWAFFGLNLKDVDCGFKMIKKETLKKIPRLQSKRGGMINAELAIKANLAGYKIAQVGVHHYPRLTGVPTGASFRVIINSYLDLLKIWWQLK